jgi:spermidine synthase
MSLEFEELDFQTTSIGDISLRRRRDPQLRDQLIFEVKLGDEFLMSSLVTAGEIALADCGLSKCEGESLDVVVGGLGLGYTACAALKHDKVGSVIVIEALAPVIEWHRRGLVPLGSELNSDGRCRLVCGNFFALAGSVDGFDHEAPSRRVHAILLDIDHSPRQRLADGDDDFYRREGLVRLSKHLLPGGVFAVWSNDPPDDEFMTELKKVFDSVHADVIEFPTPYTGDIASNTIYIAKVYS